MVHLHTKIHHHLSHKGTRSVALALGVSGLLIIGTFFITRAGNIEASELAFTEHSTLGTDAGSVIPASCESDPWTANGDGNYSGCGTPVCASTHYNCSAGSLGGTADYGAPDYQWQWWCTGPNPATNVLCAEMKVPSCGSTGPGGNPNAIASQTTYEVYAYNVNNATAVTFPTWSNTGGQDDLIWIPGTNLGGGTWRATVNFNTQPTLGQFYTHVYMNNNGSNQTMCGTIDFTHGVDPSVQVNFSLEDYIKAKALAVVSSLKDLAFAPVLAEGTK